MGCGGRGREGMLWEELRDEECRWERGCAEGRGTSMTADEVAEGVWDEDWAR